MNRYHHKLYALLHSSPKTAHLIPALTCLNAHLPALKAWWQTQPFADVASDADRINLEKLAPLSPSTKVCHPISGQTQNISADRPPLTREFITTQLGADLTTELFEQTDAETAFWWFWRFAPTLTALQSPEAPLHPQHATLPDCSVHGYQSTVSAIAGASVQDSGSAAEFPYLLIFSFSPVQEFIKSSRKFLDFWAGSYQLHYLSARLCWQVANGFIEEDPSKSHNYGPDSIIVPSLWSQEIIDALLLKGDSTAETQRRSLFQKTFEKIDDQLTPVQRFKDKHTNSLSTAGFPNMLTVLVPGQKAAKALGDRLSQALTEQWQAIGNQVRDDIRTNVISYLEKATDTEKAALLSEVFPDASPQDLQAYSGGYQKGDTFKKGELEKLAIQSCWEWNSLWDAQLDNAWEPYWSAVPLGHPHAPLTLPTAAASFEDWIGKQQNIAHSPKRSPLTIPTKQEKILCQQLNGQFNVGMWWGSLQRRLQICLQATKHTRTWQLPAAPGERSTLSGRFSALHPWLNYKADFREGGGLPEGSLRLFWAIMSKAYPGLFNGVERLNAIEITKRMAWTHGGVANAIGFNKKDFESDFDYQIRFPNLSSIASARFIKDSPQLAQAYWASLNNKIQQLASQPDSFPSQAYETFRKKTRKSAHISTSDGDYNGVMFSSKWLAEDMGLTLQEKAGLQEKADNTDQITSLRAAVDEAHQDIGLTSGSPADWWVIVLADGDNMGQFVSGKKLETYERYVQTDILDREPLNSTTNQALQDFLQHTTKRMGPATHIGLNRALLDFSNRLVPYLTERRFCGRVIYSGGDDVMAVLPLEDLPGYLRSLRAAWSGRPDPQQKFETKGGYWKPNKEIVDNSLLPDRPLFTMGQTATMSIGVAIAHKSVPLPTVLESLWEAEGKRAKGMPGKNGLCFRVIYGNGNQLEALMSGSGGSLEVGGEYPEEATDLFSRWWKWVEGYIDLLESKKDYRNTLSPLLYRLSEELPRRATVGAGLLAKAAQVMVNRREDADALLEISTALVDWIGQWEDWAIAAKSHTTQSDLGTKSSDLGKLLRFSAFWIDKRVERLAWAAEDQPSEDRPPEGQLAREEQNALV